MTDYDYITSGAGSVDYDDFEPSGVTTQVDVIGDSSINHALIAVAQEAAELLRQAYPVQSVSSDRTKTITIRRIKPKSRQIARINC